MTIGCLYSTATAADRVERVEEAGVLDQDQRALVAIGEPGGDADAFVFLAHAHELELLVRRDREQQPLAGDDVGNGEDELDAALLDGRDDFRAGQRDLRVGLCCCRCIHSQPPNAPPFVCCEYRRLS